MESLHSSGSEGLVLHGSSSHHPFLGPWFEFGPGIRSQIEGFWGGWTSEPVIKSLVSLSFVRGSYYLILQGFQHAMIFEDFHGFKSHRLGFCFSLLSSSFFWKEIPMLEFASRLVFVYISPSFFENKTPLMIDELTRLTKLGSTKLNQQIYSKQCMSLMTISESFLCPQCGVLGTYRIARTT